MPEKSPVKESTDNLETQAVDIMAVPPTQPLPPSTSPDLSAAARRAQYQVAKNSATEVYGGSPSAQSTSIAAKENQLEWGGCVSKGLATKPWTTSYIVDPAQMLQLVSMLVQPCGCISPTQFALNDLNWFLTSASCIYRRHLLRATPRMRRNLQPTSWTHCSHATTSCK